MSEPGSMTTPQPMTQRRPLWRMPDGIVRSTYFSRPPTTVWPALLPPEKRTTTFTCGVMTSTTLPLPSSPHCAPITTMLGMAAPLCVLDLREMPLRMLERVAHAQRALAAAGQVQRQQLAVRGARTAHHQHVTHALGASVGQRVVQPAADDIAGDRGAAVAQPAGQ